MTAVWEFLDRYNIVAAIIVLIAAIGAIKTTGLWGDGLALETFIKLSWPLAAGLAFGGAAKMVDLPLRPTPDVLVVACILVFFFVVAGAVQVITDKLTYEGYLNLMAEPLAFLAAARGLAANGPVTA